MNKYHQCILRGNTAPASADLWNENSAGSISMVTERAREELSIWQHRAIATMYVIIYLDAIHFKVRDEGKVGTKAFYTVYGVDVNGNRDVQGLYLPEHEAGHYWERIQEDN